MKRTILVHFIGHKKYSNTDNWDHLCFYDEPELTPDDYNSVVKARTLVIDDGRYHMLRLKHGYYDRDLGIVNTANIHDSIALKIIKTWHRIKRQLCLSLSRYWYVNGRRNIISHDSCGDITLLQELGIEIDTTV